MRRAFLALGLALALVVAGCHRYPQMPLVAFPMEGGPTSEAFELLITRARAIGYAIEFSHAAFGSFGVRARTRSVNRDPERATLVVQCHADGRATIEVVGTANDGHGHARVSRALRQEVVRLAQVLEQGVPEP